MTNNKALVLCSGGVDSTTLLARAVGKYGAENVYALSISYGQKHVREIETARAVAAHYGVQQRFLDLGAIFADSDCSLLAHSDAAIPESSYADQQAEGDGGPVSTYVALPQRALPLLGGLHGPLARLLDGLLRRPSRRLGRQRLPRLLAGVRGGHESRHRGGHRRRAVAWKPRSSPGRRPTSCARGLALGVPYELTWSCYEGGEAPCGRCATCLDRAAAFAANGVEDPALG